MRSIVATTVALLLPAICTAQEWQSLFNGNDLTGWRANNDPESFTVADGVLRVQAAKGTSAHLFYVGDRKDGVEKFKNFELEVTTRSEPESNSGVYFHTDMRTRDAAKHLLQGYEVQLNSTAKEKRKTGSLYGVVDLKESPVDETKWFTVRVRVEGKHVVVHVNDKQVVDYTEPDGVTRPKQWEGRLLSADGGAIALQAHDKSSVFYFKDVKIRRLP